MSPFPRSSVTWILSLAYIRAASTAWTYCYFSSNIRHKSQYPRKGSVYCSPHLTTRVCIFKLSQLLLKMSACCYYITLAVTTSPGAGIMPCSLQLCTWIMDDCNTKISCKTLRRFRDVQTHTWQYESRNKKIINTLSSFTTFTTPARVEYIYPFLSYVPQPEMCSLSARHNLWPKNHKIVLH